MTPRNKTKHQRKVNFSTKLVEFYNLLNIRLLQFSTKLVEFFYCIR